MSASPARADAQRSKADVATRASGMPRIVLVIGIVLAIAALGVSLAQAFSGGQPWGQLLGDNFLFARSIPFTLGLGVAIGLWRAAVWSPATQRRGGNLRRYAPGTVILHALATLAVLAGMLTGAWQYLKGLLDVDSPVPMSLVYRIHYLAATLLLLVVAAAVTDWLARGENRLLVPKGQWIRNLRGLAHELPRPLGASMGYLLGLDLRRAPPPMQEFTFYERVVSFPTWAVALGLITLTGIIKAMRYAFPIPGDILYWVSAIHVGSMVLLGLKVLDHLRYVLAPSRWPLFGSIWTGWLNAEYVARYLPGWHAQGTAGDERGGSE